jgi:hypothetical protein
VSRLALGPPSLLFSAYSDISQGVSDREEKLTTQADPVSRLRISETIILLPHGNECGKNKSNENFKTTIPSNNYDRPKTNRECGMF